MSLFSRLFGWSKSQSVETSVEESAVPDTPAVPAVETRTIHVTRRNDGVRIEWCLPETNTLKSATIPTNYSVSDICSYIRAGYRPDSYQLGFIVRSIQPGVNSVRALLQQLVTDGFMTNVNGVYIPSKGTELSTVSWEKSVW